MQLSRFCSSQSRQIGQIHLSRLANLSVKRSLAFRPQRSLHSSPSAILRFPTRVWIGPSSIARRFNSSEASHTSQHSFSDPSRPDLFYHVVQAPTPISKTEPAYALSFLSDAPPQSKSKTIIGWLPASSGAAKDGDVTLEDFVGNPSFIGVLQQVVRDGLIEGVDEIQKATAMQTIEGWMHVQDQRNIPALNRIGDPEDIIGSVLVAESQIIGHTYQPMPAYRLVTSDGVLQLTPGLAQKLQDELKKIAESEK